MNIFKNYIHVKKLNLNLSEIKLSCELMNDLINRRFGNNRVDYTGQSTMTTGLYSSYNILLYPLPEMHKLYREIKTVFTEINEYTHDFYIQCWLNFYKKNDFIDWHRHWPPECESYHGFFCVNCEPSSTTYKLQDGSIVDIKSENNNLVISKSDGDLHRTWPWEYDDPRITIAFDIVPASFIKYDRWINHWIPI